MVNGQLGQFSVYGHEVFFSMISCTRTEKSNAKNCMNGSFLAVGNILEISGKFPAILNFRIISNSALTALVS